ncbi:hypothetical protein MBM_08660 [Drepanopeziza brunnea f. sp. 'multigermtubi' MB_m1]|uniref:Uncharacterized protein n=1 Tax=Marssonina brunnea f. sp. multigermtubi (strain MB_m1) TaxID=1072389 RepID=K1WLS7_MARBU|nr:uncharacterized protein MBM_08660 [Drepanopeziza brunnea f. sp. 'multigermtubi' MB_m1]EKD13217.1 hypothetical protein MBM_08660 [Drepanopeziza brunnea f. sp. 'multigermtubi' MB_m1]
MGLFKHKDKAKPDLLSPQQNNSVPPSERQQSPRPQQLGHSQNNSFHDSTYYSNSNASSAESRTSQIPAQRPFQPPGTTITTTTTTTTTSDGTTQTYSHPYNPVTDPPPEVTETRVDHSLPQNADTKTGISQPVPQYGSPQNPVREDAQPNRIASPQTRGRPNPTIQQTAPTPGTSNPNSFMQGPARKPTPHQHGGGGSPSQFASPPAQQKGNSDSRAEAELDAAPISPTTAGGRPIPPRSEFRKSPSNQQGPIPSLVPDGPASPIMPERSERRRSGEHVVAPLNVSAVHNRSPGKAYAHNTSTPDLAQQYARGDTGLPASNEPFSPASPTTGRPRTPNFSRPGVAAAGTSPALPVSPVSASPAVSGTNPPAPGARTSVASGSTSQLKPARKLQGVASTLKGLHGAGEALRGSVNGRIAHVTRDQAEEERMRAVREKGLGEWRGSGLDAKSAGLREGFREKAEGRMRTRRASRDRDGVHGSEGPNGLEAVHETDR